jgi:hypothetical protein
MRTTASGVSLQPVSIKGKDYVTVSQRIAEVNASTMVPRYSILSTQFSEFGGLFLCQVTIEVEGKQFIGTSSVNIGGRGVDATNPIENAETSAVGRALGLAGFGSLESVASAEEVVTAISRERGNGRQQKPEQKVEQEKVQEPAAPAVESPRKKVKQFLNENPSIEPFDVHELLKNKFNTTWTLMDHDVAEKLLAELKAA